MFGAGPPFRGAIPPVTGIEAMPVLEWLMFSDKDRRRYAPSLRNTTSSVLPSTASRAPRSPAIATCPSWGCRAT